MTDDIQWNILDDQFISGKETLRRFFNDNKDMQIVSATRDHFIVEGDRASVGGEVLCRNSKSGEEYDMYYCDGYGFQNGKIKDMITYTINKKKK